MHPLLVGFCFFARSLFLLSLTCFASCLISLILQPILFGLLCQVRLSVTLFGFASLTFCLLFLFQLLSLLVHFGHACQLEFLLFAPQAILFILCFRACNLFGAFGFHPQTLHFSQLGPPFSLGLLLLETLLLDLLAQGFLFLLLLLYYFQVVLFVVVVVG